MTASLKLDLIVDDKGTVEIQKFTSKSLREFNSLGSIIDRRLGGGIKRFAAKSRSAINSIGKAVFSLQGALVGLVAGAGLGALAKSAVDTASGFEKMKLSLDTITKGRGEEWFEKLNEWALKMPVNTQKAIQSFILMRAMGLEPSIKQMTTLVDTMSALGGGADVLQGISRALGQITTKGKVSAEELNQLAERGVPAMEIIKEAFGDVELKSINANEAVQALFAGMEERFGGQSSKMQETWAGMMETIKSYWTDFQRLVMDAGLFDWMKTRLGSLVALIDKMRADGTLQKWAEETGESITKWFTQAWDRVVDLAREGKKHWQDFKLVMDVFLKVIRAIGSAFNAVGKAIGTGTAAIYTFSEKMANTGVAKFVQDLVGNSAKGVKMLAEKGAAALGVGGGETGTGGVVGPSAAEDIMNKFNAMKNETVKGPTLEPQIKKSPAVPWSQGIESMKSDLSVVGDSLSGAVDLSSANQLLLTMGQVSRAMEYNQWLLNQRGGNLATNLWGEQGRLREMYDLQLQLFKNLVRQSNIDTALKGRAAAGGGRSVQVVVNAQEGQGAKDLAKQVRNELEIMEQRGA